MSPYLFEIIVFVAGSIAGLVLARRGARRGAGRGDPSLELRRRAIRAGRAWACAILVVFALEWWFPTVAGLLGLRGTIDSMGYYQWWRFWPPVATAAIWAIIVAVTLARTRPAPLEPVRTALRRTWRTYLRPSATWLTVATLGVLAVTVLLAGLASSPGESGWYTVLEIPVGDQGSGFASFPGWGNGVPVLLAAALLAVVAWRTLTVDALAPFRGLATIEAETALRRVAASTLLTGAAAGILLGLGRLWLMIGGAGSGSVGVGIPGVGDFMFSPGYAAIAPAMGYAGAALEGLAFLLVARMVFAPVGIGAARTEPLPAAVDAK